MKHLFQPFATRRQETRNKKQENWKFIRLIAFFALILLPAFGKSQCLQTGWITNNSSCDATVTCVGVTLNMGTCPPLTPAFYCVNVNNIHVPANSTVKLPCGTCGVNICNVEITVNNFGSSSANTVVDYNSGSSSLPSCGGSSWTLSYNSIINTFEIN